MVIFITQTAICKKGKNKRKTGFSFHPLWNEKFCSFPTKGEDKKTFSVDRGENFCSDISRQPRAGTCVYRRRGQSRPGEVTRGAACRRAGTG